MRNLFTQILSDTSETIANISVSTYHSTKNYINNALKPTPIKTVAQKEEDKRLENEQKIRYHQKHLNRAKAIRGEEPFDYSISNLVLISVSAVYRFGNYLLTTALYPVRKYTENSIDTFLSGDDKVDLDAQKLEDKVRDELKKQKLLRIENTRERAEKISKNTDQAREYVNNLLKDTLGNSFIGICMRNYIQGLTGAMFSWGKLYDVLSKSPKARAVFVQSIVDNFCNYLMWVVLVQLAADRPWAAYTNDDEEEQAKSTWMSLFATAYSAKLLVRYLILNSTLNSAIKETFSEFQPHTAKDEHCDCATTYSISYLVKAPSQYIVNMAMLMWIINTNVSFAQWIYYASFPYAYGRAVGGARRHQCVKEDNEFWAQHNLYAHGLGTAMLMTTYVFDTAISTLLRKQNFFISDAIFSVVYQWFMMLVILDTTKRTPDPFQFNFNRAFNWLADKIVEAVTPTIEDSFKDQGNDPNPGIQILKSLIKSPTRELLLGHDVYPIKTGIQSRSIRLCLQEHKAFIHGVLNGLLTSTDGILLPFAWVIGKGYRLVNKEQPPDIKTANILIRLRSDYGLLSDRNLNELINAVGLAQGNIGEPSVDDGDVTFNDANANASANAAAAATATASADVNSNTNTNTNTNVDVNVKTNINPNPNPNPNSNNSNQQGTEQQKTLAVVNHDLRTALVKTKNYDNDVELNPQLIQAQMLERLKEDRKRNKLEKEERKKRLEEEFKRKQEEELKRKQEEELENKRKQKEENKQRAQEMQIAFKNPGIRLMDDYDGMDRENKRKLKVSSQVELSTEDVKNTESQYNNKNDNNNNNNDNNNNNNNNVTEEKTSKKKKKLHN